MSENPTRACPHLGLAGDASRSHAQPSADHLCYRWAEPGRIGKDHQTAFCLSDEFRDCFRLVSPDDASAVQKTGEKSSRGVFRWVAVTVVVLGIALGGAYAFLGGQLLGGGAPPPPQTTATSVPVALPPSPVPTDTPNLEPSPSPSATPEPATPTATVEPTETPVVEATPPPTEVPPTGTPGPRYHLVRAGETLAILSRMYGVTVEELARANGLQANPNLILTGQTLLIPEPRR